MVYMTVTFLTISRLNELLSKIEYVGILTVGAISYIPKFESSQFIRLEKMYPDALGL